jgi:hypothetical protein
MANLGRMLLLCCSLGLGVGLGACFIESQQPNAFRYNCESDDQCNSLEVCADGLCQQPCGAGMEACSDTTTCLNGFCSSTCPLDDDVCPDPQQCVPAYESDDPEEEIPGICTIPCDDTDNPCAEGQLCLPTGFCATLCPTGEECLSGESCIEVAEGLAVCIPSFSGGGGFF